MKGDDDVPDFQIPDDYLNEIRSKSDPAFAVIIVMKPIDRTSYAWFDDLTEGILVALGGQNDALVIADRIKLEILAAEAAEEVDADVCASDFFFFFGVYTPNQPKAMRRPLSLPFEGSVHPRENGLHKRSASRAKKMTKEIPVFLVHTRCRSIPNKSMPPPPRPFWPSPYIYESCTSTPLPALPLTNRQNEAHCKELVFWYMFSLYVFYLWQF